jgi:hypothetical protein
METHDRNRGRPNLDHPAFYTLPFTVNSQRAPGWDPARVRVIRDTFFIFGEFP